MSHSHPAGLLEAYDSLTDKHLAGYFNNMRIRRHLLRSGLITRSGRILSEREYKLNIMKRDHQKYIRECLAQAIFHKVLDMERYHQLEVKKKLETLTKKERIQRFKGENTRRFIEDNMPSLSPRPPLGPRTNRGQKVLVDEGHSSPLALAAPRPYTAPGNMQPPIRLQPLPRNPAVETVPKITSGSRSKPSLMENTAPFPIGGRKAVTKFRNSVGNSQRMDPYRLPNISSYMMPIPPPPPPANGRSTRENRSEMWRRTFRPTTAPNGFEPVFARKSRSIYKTSPHSNAAITMIYLGKNVHLAYDNPDFRDEIKVYQQHCGGENLCVYKGKLLEKETFQFISKRHHGFPFSLTFFLNGIQVNRLSSCCEYKHRKGSRLGGKRGYFGFVCVERSSPCYKCIIAMGLDKKPTSARSKKEKIIEKREEGRKGEGTVRKAGENMTPRRNEIKGDKTCISDVFSTQEIKTRNREVVTAMEEMERKEKPRPDVWDNAQDTALKYDYEEDFEVDEEKQDEKANEEGQAEEQMKGTSKSPSDDEEDNLVPEKESETSSQKAPDAQDRVEDEDDGCSDNDSEEDKQGIKMTSLASFRSHHYSSGSEDESPLRDREVHTENSTEESSRSSSPQELSENDELGQPHLLIEESLETETEDQKVTKADVETKSPPRQEDFENILEEEIERGIPEMAESSSEKSRKQVSVGEKEKKSKLQEGSTSKVKDKKAGFLGVETGATKRDGVAEARPALSSSEEPPQVAREMSALENSEAAEEGDAPGRRDAALEEQGAAALRGEGAVKEVNPGEGLATAEPPALAEQSPGERGVPPGNAGGTQAGAEADGARRLGTAAGAPVGRNEDDASAKQALMLTVLEPEEAAWEGEQAPHTAAVANKQAALDWKHLREAAPPREAGTPDRRGARTAAALGEAAPGEMAAGAAGEEAPAEPADAGPRGDSATRARNGSAEAALGGQRPARESKGVGRTGAPPSPSAAEAGAGWILGPGGRPEDLCKEDAEEEDAVNETGPKTEYDGKERPPEELDAARERRKAGGPRTAVRAGGRERGEEAPAGAAEEERGLVEEKTAEEAGSGAENQAPVTASAASEDPGLLEDSLGGGESVLEATPGFEKSPANVTLSNVTALRKAGGTGRLRAAGDAQPEGGAGPRGGQEAAPAERRPGRGPGAAGAPAGGLGGQRPRDPRTPGQAEEPEAEDGEGRGAGEGARVLGTLEDAPGRGPPTAGRLREESVDEDLDNAGTLGTGVVQDRSTEGAGDRARAGEAREDPGPGGTAAQAPAGEREVLAGSKTAEGKATAKTAASLSEAAGEESCGGEDEGPRATAEGVAVEGSAVREGTVTPAPEGGEAAPGEPGDLEGKAPGQGKGQEAGTAQEHGGQESGAGEELQGQQRAACREGPRAAAAAHPGKPDFAGSQEEPTVERESEGAAAPLNH
ncbi:glutamate-rich protein 3 isoform X2 [Nycticebus coucang]|uniref:glutamate-rich protein 3 isoform X2 n=1 Tax=Nycticebus coucang TaxID=9470 RepID=UPI00234D62F7|nr:glutamate-rich protein 3 isoform X2 [Nycticebus coucang]